MEREQQRSTTTGPLISVFGGGEEGEEETLISIVPVDRGRHRGPGDDWESIGRIGKQFLASLRAKNQPISRTDSDAAKVHFDPISEGSPSVSNYYYYYYYYYYYHALIRQRAGRRCRNSGGITPRRASTLPGTFGSGRTDMERMTF